MNELSKLPNAPRPGVLIRTERCEKCKYATPEGRSENFLCHRNAPQVVGVPTPQGMKVVSAFPTVQPQQWCAEYVPQIIAAN